MIPRESGIQCYNRRRYSERQRPASNCMERDAISLEYILDNIRIIVIKQIKVYSRHDRKANTPKFSSRYRLFEKTIMSWIHSFFQVCE